MSLSQSQSLQRLPHMSFSKMNGGMARYGKAQLEEEMAARAQLERRAAVAQAAARARPFSRQSVRGHGAFRMSS